VRFVFVRLLRRSVHFPIVQATPAQEILQKLLSRKAGKVFLLTDLKWEIFILFHAGHSQGQFRSACGRQYFLSNVSQPTISAANAECCKYGMKLLSVETKEEFDCLMEMNRGLLEPNCKQSIILF